MSWYEDEDRFGRRRRKSPFFGDLNFRNLNEMMKDMDRMMEEMFQEFANVPDELVRERELPDGTTFRQIGPFVWGRSVTVGPDGKPVIQDFGNIKPTKRLQPGKALFDLKKEREPLVDVLNGEKEITVIAELPGVDKNDISINSTENTLDLVVNAKERKYRKELNLSEKVDPKSAKASYKNGILQVTLKKLEETKPKREKIRID